MRDETPTWGTQSSRFIYDPGEFYCHSTNQHDHKEQMRAYPRGVEDMPQIVAAPPHIVAAVNEVVASPFTPYRTQHDFIRDAAVHRLEELRKRIEDNDFAERLDLEVVVQGITKRRNERDSLRSVIDAVKLEIDFYCREHNPEGVADVIANTEQIVVPSHFQREWEGHLQQWKVLLDGIERRG